MDQVEYALNVQRISLLSAGAGFLILASIVGLLDPYSNDYYIYLFLSVLFLFLTSLIILLIFGWVSLIKKTVLNIFEINQVVYQSLISSTVIVFVIALNQTNQLNIWTLTLTMASYIIYWIWAHSKS
jgi:hypothetical protein